MVKISRNMVMGFFIVAAVLASLHPLLALPSLPYKLFLFYGIIFAAAFFFTKDVRMEKKAFINTMLFTAGAALTGFGQYVFSFFNHNIMPYGAALVFAGAVLAAVSAGRDGADGLKTGENSKFEPLFLALLAAAAFILRFWGLENFLPGVWFDEVQNGSETLKMIGNNDAPVFISGFTHMPAMYFYFASLFVKLLGYGILPLRLVSCVMGTLCVAAFYFLAKQLFKDWKFALLAAFLMAFSRWHITFSRVAFLGMQAVLFEVLFLYFYFRFMERGRAFEAAAAGAILGLAQYTFSAANFTAVFAALHLAVSAAAGLKVFMKERFRGALIMLAAAFITALPLIMYAATHKDAFFQRASDINITRDIREKKSLSPLLKNLKTYSLTFNFEGDYNGRHNLYKKPLLDDFTAAMFVLGLAAALFSAPFRPVLLLFAVMMLPGLLTITIEAPQAYRISGAIPAVCLLAALGVRSTAAALSRAAGSSAPGIALAAALAISAAAVNSYQYFVLYPKNEATYMSFSPESNAIGKIVRDNSGEYEILMSPAKKIYGYYGWEQTVITDFIAYGRARHRLMKQHNEIAAASLAGKKGVILITRPSDLDENAAIEAQYGQKLEKKDVYRNPFNDNEQFYCWYIPASAISRDPGMVVFVK